MYDTSPDTHNFTELPYACTGGFVDSTDDFVPLCFLQLTDILQVHLTIYDVFKSFICIVAFYLIFQELIIIWFVHIVIEGFQGSKIAFNQFSIYLCEFIIKTCDIIPVAAPLIIHNLPDHPGLDRILVDVSGYSNQVTIILNRFASIPVLEEMTRSFIILVMPLYIAYRYPFDTLAQIFALFDEQMDMIVHQAICI